MLMAHKLLDALAGKSRETFHVIDGTPPKMGEALFNGIVQAEKFDFGSLPLEEGQKPGHFFLPPFTADEQDFWRMGLVPLPAPICWYEFVIGISRSGLLVLEHEPENRGGRYHWSSQRVDFIRGGEYVYDGVVVWASRDQTFTLDNRIQMEMSGNTLLRKSVAMTELSQRRAFRQQHPRRHVSDADAQQPQYAGQARGCPAEAQRGADEERQDATLRASCCRHRADPVSVRGRPER